MEFGKDVISRDSDGRYHAFQLKGNPGTRLGITQWNEILPQINALMLQPVEPPLAAAAVLARPYLVTNGEVDEEVHAAIRGVNSLAVADGRRPLNLIGRGELIGEWIGPIANNVWPSSTDVDRHILESWGLDGRDFLPAESFHRMIMAALPFDEPPRTGRTLSRTLFGAAIINEMCLRRYVEAGNHVSMMLGRGLFLAAAYSLIERAELEVSAFEPLRELFWTSIGDDYVSLLADLEATERRHYYEGEVHLQFPYHEVRLFLLKALIALMALSIEKQPKAFESAKPHIASKKEVVERFMAVSVASPVGLGEFAIPQFLLNYWYLCCHSGNGATDLQLGTVLETLMTANSKKERNVHVPNPYHLMPQVLEELMDRLLAVAPRFRRPESFRYQLWCALPLFGLLVRRNMKRTAQMLFPEMTRFIHRKTVIKDRWAFGLFRAEAAEEIGERLQFPASWADYVERTKVRDFPPMPPGLADDLLTLGLFVIVCPFRLTEETTYHLDEVFVGNWHST